MRNNSKRLTTKALTITKYYKSLAIELLPLRRHYTTTHHPTCHFDFEGVCLPACLPGNLKVRALPPTLACRCRWQPSKHLARQTDEQLVGRSPGRLVVRMTSQVCEITTITSIIIVFSCSCRFCYRCGFVVVSTCILHS